MSVRDEVETEVPKARTDSDIMKLIRRVITEDTQASREKQISAETTKKVNMMYQQICDSQGNCRLVTKEEFDRWQHGEKDREEKKEKMPEMNERTRQDLKPDEQSLRDVLVAAKMAANKITHVDAFRFVKNDPESRGGLKREVLAILEPEDVNKYLTEKCFVGKDGRLVCQGLQESGYRVQRKDGKDWKTLGLSEEEEKKEEKRTEKHF